MGLPLATLIDNLQAPVEDRLIIQQRVLQAKYEGKLSATIH